MRVGAHDLAVHDGLTEEVFQILPTNLVRKVADEDLVSRSTTTAEAATEAATAAKATVKAATSWSTSCEARFDLTVLQDVRYFQRCADRVCLLRGRKRGDP